MDMFAFEFEAIGDTANSLKIQGPDVSYLFLFFYIQNFQPHMWLCPWLCMLVYSPMKWVDIMVKYKGISPTEKLLTLNISVPVFILMTIS